KEEYMRLWVAPIVVSVLSFAAFGQSYTIETLGGGGRPENIQGNKGTPGQVNGVVTDQGGNVYMLVGSVVMRWDAASGALTLVAGNAKAGFSGDGGKAVDAALGARLGGIAVDASGNVYIADSDNHRVREVTTDGMIRTVAGTGTRGFSGDN